MIRAIIYFSACEMVVGTRSVSRRGRTGLKGDRGPAGPAGGGGGSSTRTVKSYTLALNATLALGATDTNCSVSVTSVGGATISLPASPANGSWIEINVVGAGATVNGAPAAMNTTLTYVAYAGNGFTLLGAQGPNPVLERVKALTVITSLALLPADVNSYFLLSPTAAGTTVTLPAAQPVGTWVVIRLASFAATVNGAAQTADSTVTYLTFATGVWQAM